MKYLKNSNVRKTIFITLFIIFIYRVGSYITVPGIDTNMLKQLSQYSGGGAISLFLNGQIGMMSIFALGVIPYITASIVVQLLEMDIVPAMAE